jgi:glycosyltransferase involved in cell wall biosynthesis
MNPRILLVGNFLSGGGAAPSVSEALRDQLRAAGWPVIATSTRPGRLARVGEMAWTVWRERHRFDAANIEVYSGAAFAWAELIARLLRRLGKPFILTLHGGNLPAFARRHPARVRRLLASAAAVTAPSRYLLETMRGYRADLRLLPNPLDIRVYRFQPRERAAPRLIWLRAFHAIYNPQLAPRVVAALAPEFPALHLTMIGPDKGDGSASETRRLAGSLGVAAHIAFPGAIPKTDVPDWLERADIFLNTTNVDNTPVSVLEAMACGLCVVSSNAGGLPYLLDDGNDSLLVPPDDAAAMAEAIRRLLHDGDLAARLSQQARRKAETFDWTAILPQWESLLREVAGHTPVR